MDQKRANEIFRSELGRQLTSFFTTPDDKVFIRHEEAMSHSQDILGYDEIESNNNIDQWYEDFMFDIYDENLSDAYHFIKEKAGSRGWDNALHFAEDKYDKVKIDRIQQIFNWEFVPEYSKNSLNKYHVISSAIEVILKDHPEYQEEGTTGWDLIRNLKSIQDLYKSDNGIEIPYDDDNLPF